jgi:peptidoglycan/LPS O-acetylase OafA/YrhL
LHIGVPIFFVLSGFLITLRYSEQASLNRHWLRDYARNRFARIYPIYFLITMVTLVVLPLAAGASIDWTTLTMNLTLLRGFFTDFNFSGVPQAWSLTVEERFYLIHMGFMQTSIHKALPKSWKSHRYWAELLLLITISIILYLLVERPLNRLLRAKAKKPLLRSA